MRGRDKFLGVQREVFSHVRIEPEADIQEVQVSGDVAYCWNYLTVNILPTAGGAAMRRKGYTLTVLRRNESGQWQVSRDANLLGDAE
ncbi:MAG: SgcJ/EcaC family oxidoreductase [Acidobacteriales bacterium]|nr:SgcJ/EcaC family oxidoreductase [Terriglobales bacterium]